MDFLTGRPVMGGFMIRVAVIGATGYAGAELVRILSSHPLARMTTLTSRQYAGKLFSDVFPSFYNRMDLPLEAYDAEKIVAEADLVFMALPHQLPMNMVPELLEGGCRVVDLSADFRFSDPREYEAFYETHRAPDLCGESVYGLSEFFKEDISAARLVGNPGCYPTCILLPLLPLVEKQWVDLSHVVCDAKSGVSGAGRGVSLATHYCEIAQGFKAYKVGAHRHRPEIASVIEGIAGQKPGVTFVPHLVPTIRGMLATSYLKLKEDRTEAEIRQCLEEAYDGRPFVRILPENRFPDLSFVRGTNYCDIGLRLDPETGVLILVSAIDNLVKGASGQAVQNMNIMWKLEETLGLDILPPVI
ncbi:N-acetyl-gamma-glutamyl-phosphate reductase [Desulfobotulus alkaliphilus]|uniref:N-acetyl-gamma-glutamyl-phosphate reductase n=1 Tax=Desulfobotulus alkaliphilus TaxID=622671 RepID=A0A562RKH6_9BACT|nr:N-acetyl-gamma-glutamyl-phosphate reductase [Desulfobotulus alkaliphilus]TWI68930.1 N-acetyl-gamma-glutamyl-phosphate reductase [Desulfobotulus alkaliphilus]